MSDTQENFWQLFADSMALRKRAEEQARTMGPSTLPAQTPDEIQRLLHELQVHQIELEMQNEELRRTQEDLAAQKERYFDLYDLAPIGYGTHSSQGLILEVNLTASILLGMPRGALLKQPITGIIFKEDQDIYYLLGKKLFETGKPQECELRLKKEDGAYFWAHLATTVAHNEQGSPICRFVLRDITESRQAREKLQLAAGVFNHAGEGILITDGKGTIVNVNDAFIRITGYSREDAVGQNPRFLNSGKQDTDFYRAMWNSLTTTGHWSGEIWNQRKDGEIYPEQLTISAIRDEHGTTQQYVGLFSDITALKGHQKQLEYLAQFDALTSLPNRVLLADRLHQAMAQAQRRQQLLAVVYLDLDGFKSINDRNGHDLGDLVLKKLAKRMKETLRKVDTLARIGGDEFVAVLSDLEDITASVPLLNRLLAAASQPVMSGELSLSVSASLGVTYYPQANDINADQLMRQADQAMYQAKVAGKNRYHVFDAALDSSIRIHHESLERIRLALEQHEFVLHYQPKVNMRSGQLIGAEALIRWQHPEKGLLPPREFLPVIEDHPLAVDVGEWVIDSALTQIGLWQLEGLDLPVSVNLGAKQLQQVDFVQRLKAILARHAQVNPTSLEFEVLETSALADMDQVSHVIDECAKIGMKFALDDFGTGYSSLTYFKRLNVDELKIDQSFVKDMLNNPEDLTILEGVIGLATAFRRNVIAEGVESNEQGERLIQLGCHFAQGYGIARPMPGEQIPNWADHWHTPQNWADCKQIKHEDHPLLYGVVEHRAWIVALRRNIDGLQDETLPTMDHHQCRFGAWLDQLRDKGLESFTRFQQIDSLHQQVHKLGADIIESRESKNSEELDSRMDELYVLSDGFIDKLKDFLRDS